MMDTVSISLGGTHNGIRWIPVIGIAALNTFRTHRKTELFGRPFKA